MYTLNAVNQANSALVEAFLNFMLSPQLQQQVTALHYIPIANLKFPPQPRPPKGSIKSLYARLAASPWR